MSEAKADMKSSNSRQSEPEGETGQLVLRAAEAHHVAELARKRVRLAKAEYKKARKAFKKAKKTARQARKLAKAASKVLKAQAKDRAAKQPQSARRLQRSKRAPNPALFNTPSGPPSSIGGLARSESSNPPT